MTGLVRRVMTSEARLVTRRTTVWLRWVGVLTLPVLAALAVLCLGWWLAAPAADPIVADAVIVLGGDGGNGRVAKAGALFRAGFAGQVVLTGSSGRAGAAAEVKSDPRVNFLNAMGVPASVLLLDGISRNSWDEAVNTRRMMEEKGWRRVLVVSDPPHLRRLQLAWGHALSDDRHQFVLVASEADWWNPDTWWRNERSARFVGRETLGLLFYALRVALNEF